MHTLEDGGEVRITHGLVLFWGGWPSNWEPHPFESPAYFTVDGVKYNCVEQYMMAQKAAMFGDDKTRRKIMKQRYPKSMKELGRQVANYDDDKWTAKRFEVVLRGVTEKFRQNPELKALLLATGDNEFVEASPEDDIWGIGLAMDDPDALVKSHWKGQNLLGKALTQARNILRQE